MTRRDHPNPRIERDADLCSPAMRYVREQSARGLIRAIGRLGRTDDDLYFEGWNGDQESVLLYRVINRAIHGGQSGAIPAISTVGPRVVPYEVADNPRVSPYIVFYAFGNDQIQAFEGPTVNGVTVTVESRAGTFEECVCVSQEVLNRLRSGGKLRSIFSTLDDGPSNAKGRVGVAVRSNDGGVERSVVRDRGTIIRRIIDVEIAGR